MLPETKKNLALYIGAAFVTAIAIVLHLLAHSSHAAEKQKQQITLSFGVVPQQSASKLAVKWTPLLNYLSLKTGYRIDFRTAKNIPTFEKLCSSGEYDLAYMNPYHYTVFHESPGYEAMAREELKSLKGIIVVRKDSPYKDLTELEGKTLAFPSPAAFAASIITQGHMKSHGINIKPQYVSSHDSVYRSVVKGLYPAGGGIPRTFKNVDPAIKSQLKVLWTSNGYTPHAIAFHPRVPEEAANKISSVLAEMKKTTEGKKILETLNFRGVIPAEDSDWNDVRALKIDTLKEPL